MDSNTSPSALRRVDVIASLPMERVVRAMNLPAALRFSSEQVSLETSQQLALKETEERLLVHHENLRKLLKSEKPTGTPHLFVLDPEQLARGDYDAQATLQALASAQFSSSDLAAVAMLPPTGGYTTAGTAAATLVKETCLNNTALVTLESRDEIQHWLNKI